MGSGSSGSSVGSGRLFIYSSTAFFTSVSGFQVGTGVAGTGVIVGVLLGIILELVWKLVLVQGEHLWAVL